jgi:hypothetical protein
MGCGTQFCPKLRAGNRLAVFSRSEEVVTSLAGHWKLFLESGRLWTEGPGRPFSIAASPGRAPDPSTPHLGEAEKPYPTENARSDGGAGRTRTADLEFWKQVNVLDADPRKDQYPQWCSRCPAPSFLWVLVRRCHPFYFMKWRSKWESFSRRGAPGSPSLRSAPLRSPTGSSGTEEHPDVSPAARPPLCCELTPTPKAPESGQSERGRNTRRLIPPWT